MNIRKNNEESFFIEQGSNKLYFAKNMVTCYIISISPNESNERTFTISSSTLDFTEKNIYDAFLEFLISMFGNTILRGDYMSPRLNIDSRNKTITILSDSSNHALLKISYLDNQIKLQITKEKEEDFTNHDIYCYSDCNLRGGYISPFVNLFESLNLIVLHQEQNTALVRKQINH